MTCSIVGCGAAVRVRGMCQKCYQRWWVTQPEQRERRAAAQRERRKNEGCRQRERARQSEYDRLRRAPGTEGAQKHRDHMREYARLPHVKARSRERMKEWAARPEVAARIRAASRFRFSGFTAEITEKLRLAQSGLCAICTRTMRLGGKQPDSEAADHCHTLRQPRGLLCSACNKALGVYEKHQRPAGLRLDAYEVYLANPPAKRILGE